MGFVKGYGSVEQPENVNPFTTIFKRIDETLTRKREMQREDEKDAKELTNFFKKLGEQHKYNLALEGEKAKQDAFYKDYQPSTRAEGGRPLQGTPFQSLAKGGLYKRTNDVDKELKGQNLLYMKNINKNMAGGGTGAGTDLVYRKADTGEEVTKAVAEQAIASGDRNYIITQRNVSKSGVRETPLIKAPDLTQEEKQYVISSNRIQGRIASLKDSLNQIKGEKGSPQWKKFQSQNLHPAFIKDNSSMEDVQSEIKALKSDIPFIRGGKQLTPEEGKRVDYLLNPFGKSDERYQKDLDIFNKEFVEGTEIMIGGVSAISKQGAKQSSGKTITLPSGGTIQITGQ